jgi:hypothetical protein
MAWQRQTAINMREARLGSSPSGVFINHPSVVISEPLG